MSYLFLSTCVFLIGYISAYWLAKTVKGGHKVSDHVRLAVSMSLVLVSMFWQFFS
jgi:hypothetical protein